MQQSIWSFWTWGLVPLVLAIFGYIGFRGFVSGGNRTANPYLAPKPASTRAAGQGGDTPRREPVLGSKPDASNRESRRGPHLGRPVR